MNECAAAVALTSKPCYHVLMFRNVRIPCNLSKGWVTWTSVTAEFSDPWANIYALHCFCFGRKWWPSGFNLEHTLPNDWHWTETLQLIPDCQIWALLLGQFSGGTARPHVWETITQWKSLMLQMTISRWNPGRRINERAWQTQAY